MSIEVSSLNTVIEKIKQAFHINENDIASFTVEYRANTYYIVVRYQDGTYCHYRYFADYNSTDFHALSNKEQINLIHNLYFSEDMSINDISRLTECSICRVKRIINTKP